ncbi:hypothetical protein Tco_1348429 [Tanacetum coccineum]
MDDPNITMEEYIRLEEEKARKRGKVFKWETSKYGKIWYDEDVHDLRFFETEFPAIVFNDNFTSNEIFYCEPMLSFLNDNEIDFRISFDESDDEDYTVIFDKNSFSYKIISTNDLKTDSKNDNEKVNMPLFPSPEPSVSCIDDLDFFKDFENEFPAIVYNDALTSKSDFSTEPTLCPQHIDEFDIKDETSLSEYDEVEQNILYFNDLFPFNIMYHGNLKSDKDNDDNEIDMMQSSRDMAPLPPRDQGYLWLHYQVEGYTEEIVHDFEQRLETIFGRQVNRVHILDFEGLTPDMRQDLPERMRMVYTGDDGQEDQGRDRVRCGWDFLRGSPFYTYIKDPVRRLCHRHTKGRKSGARLSRGHFIRRLAHHFSLVSDDGLRGLSVIAREIGDDWAWVAPRPERWQVAAAGAPETAEDAPIVDKGAQADLVAGRTMPKD